MTDDRERAPEKRFLPPLHADVWKAIDELREKHHAWWPGDLKPSQKEVIEMAISELHQKELPDEG